VFAERKSTNAQAPRNEVPSICFVYNGLLTVPPYDKCGLNGEQNPPLSICKKRLVVEDTGSITFKHTRGDILAIGEEALLVFTDAGHAFEEQCNFI
jgi:hypothetical protein